MSPYRITPKPQTGGAALIKTVTAVANAKGGTAKTTTSVALAAESAHRGHRTLLIDLDVQANATRHLLGGGVGDDGKAMFRSLLDGDPLLAVPTTDPNLFVAPAGRRTQDLADALARMVREAAPEDLATAYESMRTTLHKACAEFEIVFIDTPPSEQSATLIDFVYAASTHVLLPTKIDENSTTAVSNALTALVKLSRRGASVGDPLGILLVDVDTGGSRLTEEALAAVSHIGGIVAPFRSIVSHRAGPVAYARKAGLTPRQFLSAAEDAHKQRFAALKAGTAVSSPPWNAGSAARLVADYAAVFDELMRRIEEP